MYVTLQAPHSHPPGKMPYAVPLADCRSPHTKRADVDVSGMSEAELKIMDMCPGWAYSRSSPRKVECEVIGTIAMMVPRDGLSS